AGVALALLILLLARLLLPLLVLLALLPLLVLLALLALLRLLALALLALVLVGITLVAHGLGSNAWMEGGHATRSRTPTRNIRAADRPASQARELVEWKGIEPSTFALRTRRSPS